MTRSDNTRSDGNDQLTLDIMHRYVADERRQHVIDYLQAIEDGTASLDDLVDYVVEQETHSPAPSRETVTIALYHVHLPLLADHGILDFDERTETARYRTRPKIEQMVDAE